MVKEEQCFEVPRTQPLLAERVRVGNVMPLPSNDTAESSRGSGVSSGVSVNVKPGTQVYFYPHNTEMSVDVSEEQTTLD